MGRTMPSITMQLDIEENAFQPFRRALRKSDQAIYDELFAAAKNYRSAAAMAARALPMESLLFAMLIDERREIKHLQVKVAELEEKLRSA
jgi:hypothetical protein